MIFGRDKIVKDISGVLQKKSVLFVAERRVGKTEVLKLLKGRMNQSHRAIYLDVENVSSPIDLVERILDKVSANLKLAGKTKRHNWFESIKSALSGLKFKDVNVAKQKGKNWKKLLTLTMEEICNNTNGLFILLLDEVPYMLQKIHQQEKLKGITDNSALEILDTLRHLRQTQSKLRMVYTGSIGLHHVLDELRQGLSAEPLNDMDTIELQPLSDNSALEMANHLMQMEQIEAENPKVLRSIINQCDKVPFYIEKMIKRLSLLTGKITEANIDHEIEIIITDAKDELEMSHFRARLKDYYIGVKTLTDGSTVSHAKIAKNLLDNFAVSTEKLSIDDCHRKIKSTFALDDRDLIIELLDYLARDYYIQCDTDKKYKFCFTLIKRWWVKAHGLDQE